MSVEVLKSNKAFGGTLYKLQAKSEAYNGLETKFNVFIPGGHGKFPVLYYMAGLTCDEDTGAMKGGFIGPAAEHGIALVFVDTSPRGAGINGEDEDWEFGTAAGFYLDATTPEYSTFYKGFTLITKEFPTFLRKSELPLDLTRQSLMGHSMGGHGALTLYLLSESYFASSSAFAPITNPTKCPWGEKAFKGYLKGGVEEGKAWDATELIKKAKGKDINILFDWGDSDDFYKKGQLLPENFLAAAREAGFTEEQVKGTARAGYDHSYYFISTFAAHHIKFHAHHLKSLPSAKPE